MNKSKTTGKSLSAKAAALCGIALLGVGALAGANLFPRVDVVTHEVTRVDPTTAAQLADAQAQLKTLQANPVKVTETVYVDKPVEVIKEVPVDDGKLDDLLKVVMATDGQTQLVTDGLDDLSIAEVSDHFVLAADMVAIAETETKKRALGELDKMVVPLKAGGTLTLDEDDMSRLRLSEDPGYVCFDDFDFEEKDGKVLVFATVRQDGHTFDVEFKVTVRDTEFRKLEVNSVVEN